MSHITSNPARSAVAVTASDATSIPATRGLYVGGAGNATLVFEDGTEVALVGLLAGVVYPFRVTKVKSTGLTAADLVALY